MPYTGASENITIGLGLVAIIIYSRKMLNRSRANTIARTLNRRTFRG